VFWDAVARDMGRRGNDCESRNKSAVVEIL